MSLPMDVSHSFKTDTHEYEYRICVVPRRLRNHRSAPWMSLDIHRYSCMLKSLRNADMMMKDVAFHDIVNYTHGI